MERKHLQEIHIVRPVVVVLWVGACAFICAHTSKYIEVCVWKGLVLSRDQIDGDVWRQMFLSGHIEYS